MAATRYVEDLSGDARDFNKAKWIRQNRKYPADPPAELLAYKDTLYEIPRQYQLLLIPNLTLNIIQFTELKLPETTSTLIEYAAKNSFSEQEATVSYGKTEEESVLHWTTAFLPLLVQKNHEQFMMRPKMIFLNSRH